MSQKAAALERFSDLYAERRAMDKRLEEAAIWILNQGWCPYKVGDWVTPPAVTKMAPFEVRTIKIECEPHTGRIFWAFASGSTTQKAGGFFRLPATGPYVPPAAPQQSQEQRRLL